MTLSTSSLLKAQRRLNAAPVNGGFSLIEVTFAIGVLYFAAISIFGLLSVAAGITQKSISTELARRISTEIFGDMTQSGTVPLNPTTYFDMDGREVSSADRVFEAWHTILPCELPGSTQSVLQRVVVQVFVNPSKEPLVRGASGLVEAPRPGMEVATFQFHLNDSSSGS